MMLNRTIDLRPRRLPRVPAELRVPRHKKLPPSKRLPLQRAVGALAQLPGKVGQEVTKMIQGAKL